MRGEGSQEFGDKISLHISMGRPMTQTQDARIIKLVNTGIIILLGMLFSVILRRAWIGEDAYITFRTVDNFLNGYGLTWNPGERVQAYTHPLWMLLVSFFSFFTREIYFTVTILSLVLSFTAVILIPTKLSKSLFGSALAIVGLLCSNAFVDYSTSGLENPLSYLLAGLFLLRFFEYKGSHKDLFILSLLASLAAFNRLDSFVIYIPALVYAFWQTKSRFKALLYAALGQLPLVAWELFSIIYYGFPFPNTYYAKLAHMLPANELLVQGLRYCMHSLMIDPITLITILSTVVAAVWFGVTRKEWQNLVVALGAVIYVAAIVRTGGDFMSGRFFVLPFFVMVVTLSRINYSKLRPWLQVGLLTVPVVLGLLATPSTYEITDNEFTSWYGIVNEHTFYFPTNGLINQSRDKIVPHHPWVDLGKANQIDAQQTGTKYVQTFRAVGMVGYFSGPDVHIIDPYGLSDALIARMPAMHNPNWRIGHHLRVVPDGYEESIRAGQNLLADEQLAQYYDKLVLIISGDLFSAERFKTILAMNLGRYQPLIDLEHYQFPYEVHFLLSELPQAQAGSQRSVNFNPNGWKISIFLEFISHASKVEIGLDAQDECLVLFSNNKNTLDTVRVGMSEGVGIQPRVVTVPEVAVGRGYDFIRLVPASGDSTCVPGWIKLLE